MTILKDTYDFKIGEIVFAKNELYDKDFLIRIKDKGYEVLDISPTFISVKLEDNLIWRSRKKNWYRNKNHILNFL